MLSANLLTHPVGFITLLILTTKTDLMLLSEVVPYPGDHKEAKLVLAKEGYSHVHDFGTEGREVNQDVVRGCQ